MECTRTSSFDGKTNYFKRNGYLVLRFLADDVGKELDVVLDAILRAENAQLSGSLSVQN